jgi:hypothetical protein
MVVAMTNMPLSQYIADSARRTELAAAMGASPDYLWQVASGWKGRRASPAFAERVEEKTNGVVPKEWVIWPPAGAAAFLRTRATANETDAPRRKRAAPRIKRRSPLPRRPVHKVRGR